MIDCTCGKPFNVDFVHSTEGVCLVRTERYQCMCGHPEYTGILHKAEGYCVSDQRRVQDPSVGSSYISDSAAILMDTLIRKNSDYAPTGEFSNFERAAAMANITVLQTMLVQLEIKMTRIDKLTDGLEVPQNESLKDSFLDLAGYALIAHAYLASKEEGRGA